MIDPFELTESRLSQGRRSLFATLSGAAEHRRMAGSRDGTTWAQEFARFPARKAVVRDDEPARVRGVRLDNGRRRDAGLPEFGQTLDVFHTLREGGRALRQTWGVATRALVRAEVAQKAVDRPGCQGRPHQGHGTQAHRLWRQAK